MRPEDLANPNFLDNIERLIRRAAVSVDNLEIAIQMQRRLRERSVCYVLCDQLGA